MDWKSNKIIGILALIIVLICIGFLLYPSYQRSLRLRKIREEIREKGDSFYDLPYQEHLGHEDHEH